MKYDPAGIQAFRMPPKAFSTVASVTNLHLRVQDEAEDHYTSWFIVVLHWWTFIYKNFGQRCQKRPRLQNNNKPGKVVNLSLSTEL